MRVFPAALLEPGYRVLGRTSAAAQISEKACLGFGCRGNGGRNTRLEQGLQSNADHMAQAFFPHSVSVNITLPPLRVDALSPTKRRCGPLCGKCNPNQSWSATMWICAPFSQHHISVCVRQPWKSVSQELQSFLWFAERRGWGERWLSLHVFDYPSKKYTQKLHADAMWCECGGISQQNKCLFLWDTHLKWSWLCVTNQRCSGPF